MTLGQEKKKSSVYSIHAGHSFFFTQNQKVMKIHVNYLSCLQLNRVKAVEKEKDDLEGAKDEAMEFLGMENEITKKKNTLYQKYV